MATLDTNIPEVLCLAAIPSFMMEETSSNPHIYCLRNGRYHMESFITY